MTMPTDMPTPRCETSQGDQDVGVFAYYDPTCLLPDGDFLGCFDDGDGACRHCQEFKAIQSEHLLPCP